MHRRPLVTIAMTLTTLLPLPAASLAATARAPGPAGSLVIVEESQAIPIVQVAIAARTGSASDPRGLDGLSNFAAELARRSAGGKTRHQLDEAIDALGASLDVLVEPDSVRFVGQVLARNLRPFLKIIADIIVRPDFDAGEFGRTRDEILAQLDELRNDDHALCGRFFDHRLYGDHPYGKAADGTSKSLARIRRPDVAAAFRRTFVGGNLVFAAAGAVTLDGFRQVLAAAFAGLPEGPPPKAPDLARPPVRPGWRVQIVDKPDRKQTQIMFGHAGPPASDPDFLPLAVAMSSFGGRGMRSTLMDEARTKRGLAYGAYMDLVPRRGPGFFRGWIFTGADKTVTTLKLMLRLYKDLARTPPAAARVRFFQNFLAGTFASDMDDPAHRLAARLGAELEGLPADFVDTYVERIRAVTPQQVAAAIGKHITADNLTITLVATASVVTARLTEARVDPGAIDVVAYDSY